MLTRIRRFLAPPVFEDEDKTHTASLLHVILLVILAAALLYPLALTVIGETIGSPVNWIIPLLNGVTLGLIFLVRRGYVQQAGVSLAFVLWMSFTIPAYTFAGLHDTAVTGYFIVIILTSLVASGRTLLFFSLLSIAAVAGAFYAEHTGALVVSIPTPSAPDDLILLIVLLSVSALLLRVVMGRIAREYERARRNEQALIESNRELVDSRAALEARTHDLEHRSAYLEASAEVGRAASSILDRDQLIREVVKVIREQFNLYYVGLFLKDTTGEWAVLRAGTGEAGQAMLARGHRIKTGEGMIGWSIAHAQARIALEAGEDAVRLATAELPETRSEAAIPLRSRDQVLGALTVQDTQPHAFDQATIAALQTMADQVAVAIENARLFAESQEALEAMRRAYGETSREAWMQMVRARPDLGYVCDVQGTRPVEGQWRPEMVQASQTGQTVRDDGQTVAVPIEIRDQVLGVVRLRKPDDAGEWTAEEIALMENLTEQLGVALDSARLYRDTQQRAAHDRVVGEVAARVRESLDVERVLKTAAQEVRQALGLPEVVIRLGPPPPSAPTQHPYGTRDTQHEQEVRP